MRPVPEGLFERAAELARIDALLGAARVGRGGVLLITGPAGIGRTALLEAARQRARRAGMQVLSARGRELESGFSFGVARQLFEPLLAGAGAAQRETLLAGPTRPALIGLGIEPAAAQDDPLFEVVHGLYWLAVNGSQQRPVLVAVDDLQWADQASLCFLLYLADRLAGRPVAVALTGRGGEGGAADLLARLEQVADGGVVCPAPLGREAVRAQLTAAFGMEPAEGFTRACVAVTGGNPFLLREAIRSLRENGISPVEAGADRVAGLGPVSVARAVASRVAQLSPAAAGITWATAILGDGTALRHAAALAGVALADATAAADGLAGIGMLESGTPLRFVHSIVRTAVHNDIPAAERGLRHAQAAQLLAAEGADPEAVAAHLLACEPAGSAEVVERLRAAAARALTRGSPRRAAGYLRRTLAESANVSLRATLLHELGRAETLGREPAAAQHLREALELSTDPARRATVALDLVELLVLAGKREAGGAVVDAALAELAACDGASGDRDGALAMRLQAWWAGLGAYDPRLVGEFDRRLEELLATAREQGAGSRPLAAQLAGILAGRGERTGQARAMLDHALAGDRPPALADSDSLVASAAPFAAMWLDEHARAETLAEQLIARARSRGSVAGTAIGTCLRVAVRARRGDLPGAGTDVRTAVETGQDHAMALAVPQALYWGVDALTERAELADVAALATGIELDPDLAQTLTGAMLRETRGRLALAAADLDTARVELRAAAATYKALHLLNPNGLCWRSALALAIAGEDPAQAQRLAASELADAWRLGFARPAGIALRTLGVLEGGERGRSRLRQAAVVLAGSYARLEHARALVELGAALRRANQRAAARQPLRSGLDLACRCGATRLAERAMAELHATGARPRRAVLTGPEALTASEWRVAEMAASGISNPHIAQALFVTLNTVEGHLRHAYQKLSISSRTQLPAALRHPPA